MSIATPGTGRPPKRGIIGNCGDSGHSWCRGCGSSRKRGRGRPSSHCSRPYNLRLVTVLGLRQPRRPSFVQCRMQNHGRPRGLVLSTPDHRNSGRSLSRSASGSCYRSLHYSFLPCRRSRRMPSPGPFASLCIKRQYRGKDGLSITGGGEVRRLSTRIEGSRRCSSHTHGRSYYAGRRYWS